jgi:hypothetical protein
LATARQYLIPGGPYANETGTRQYLIPGGQYLDESSSSLPPGQGLGGWNVPNNGNLIFRSNPRRNAEVYTDTINPFYLLPGGEDVAAWNAPQTGNTLFGSNPRRNAEVYTDTFAPSIEPGVHQIMATHNPWAGDLIYRNNPRRISEQYTDYFDFSIFPVFLPPGQGIGAWHNPWAGDMIFRNNPRRLSEQYTDYTVSPLLPSGQGIEGWQSTGDAVGLHRWHFEGMQYTEAVGATFIPGANITPLVTFADAGNSMRRQPWRLPGQQYAEPVGATFIPSALPSPFAWDVAQQGRPSSRPWQPSAEFLSQPWPDLINPGQLLPALQEALWFRIDADRRRKPFHATPIDDFIKIPDYPELYWIGTDIERHFRRSYITFHATPLDDFFATPSYSESLIATDNQGFRPAPQRPAITDSSEFPSAAIYPPGILASVMYWYGDEGGLTRPPRPRPVLSEIDGLPAPAVQIDVPVWSSAMLAMPAEFIRARTWHETTPEDMAPILWEGANIATDMLGHVVWDVQQAARAPRRWIPGSEGVLGINGANPILAPSVLFALPWAPLYDDGSRAQGSHPPWFAAPDWEAPPWIAAGLIIVSGPFYVCAGQWYQAGADDGSIGTPE